MVKVRRIAVTPPPPPPDVIEIELDLDTAITLQEVLMNVGGPCNSYRGQLEVLLIQLGNAVVPRDPTRVLTGAIHLR
jgi:hypothetical protein